MDKIRHRSESWGFLELARNFKEIPAFAGMTR